MEVEGKGGTSYSPARTDGPVGARMWGETCNFGRFAFLSWVRFWALSWLFRSLCKNAAQTWVESSQDFLRIEFQCVPEGRSRSGLSGSSQAIVGCAFGSLFPITSVQRHSTSKNRRGRHNWLADKFNPNPTESADAMKGWPEASICSNPVPPFPECRGRDDAPQILHLFRRVPPFPTVCTSRA